MTDYERFQEALEKGCKLIISDYPGLTQEQAIRLVLSRLVLNEITIDDAYCIMISFIAAAYTP